MSETDIVTGRLLQFEADGRRWAIRQPLTEERDDARAIQRTYEALWRKRPEIEALRNEPADDEELAGIDAAIERAQGMLEDAEGTAVKDALKRRIAALRKSRKRWTLADQIVGDRAITGRDRWLTMHLLMKDVSDGKGKPVYEQAFDATDEHLSEAWEDLPLIVKDTARPVIWHALQLVEDASFLSVKASG